VRNIDKKYANGNCSLFLGWRITGCYHRLGILDPINGKEIHADERLRSHGHLEDLEWDTTQDGKVKLSLKRPWTPIVL
jgi:hypothetical protein